MSHLAVAVHDYCSRPGITARDIENRAGVPGATISHILRDTHPRPERFGQLLRAVDDETAQRWLIAYLRDDCPPEYLPRLQILIQTPGSSPGSDATATTLRETAAAYGQTLDHSPAAVLAAWHRLQTAIQADTSLARWFIKTVQLILGA